MKNINTNQGKISLKIFFLLLIAFLNSFVACDDNSSPNVTPDPNDTITILDSSEVDASKIYQPAEYKNDNWYKSSSRFYYGRSKQSDHFIVMWEPGFGADPNADSVLSTYRVDIDDLLEKAEEFYDINVNQLKFAVTGQEKSNLDKYKIMILLYYTTDWMAYGSGFDDVIGGLWVSPSTCHPVGSTIAHEIGHSFQYQTYCDLLAYSGIYNDFTRGFRYGFGGNGGNAFWEQCAQWQSFQSYPEQAFSSYNFGVHMDNYHRHFCHEWQRYASYMLHYYWADKRGIDAIGKIWRESVSPEDPMETYMRLYNLTVEEFNDEMYDAAAHLATFDIDEIRELGKNYIGQYKYGLLSLGDNSYQVSYDKCPGTTGYNIIPLNIPTAGTEISVKFSGLTPGSLFASGDPGEYTDADATKTTTNYNTASFSAVGWRFGFVALLENNTRVYSDMNTSNSISSSVDASFTIPAGCKKLWLVVLGAPTIYSRLPWDEKEINDAQWPYKVKFTNTDLYGNVTFDGTETQKDTTLTYEVSFPFSSTTYPGATVTVDYVALAKAFVLQPSDISAKMGNEIVFYGVESNGTLNSKTTANGYGHWFSANGDIISWGADAMVYSEYDATNFTFSIGQYPGHCASGNHYTIKQALVYSYDDDASVQATIVFNITIE